MDTIRIAMWSGPRNISTALMRSWGNRPDTVVCDEPLYAHYLQATGIDHPGRDEVLRSHESDWRKVVNWLVGPPREHPNSPAAPADHPQPRIFYQKHMAHHLLPNIERDWLAGLRHALLIRNPREMLPSLARNLPHPRLEDTGLPQQLDLLRELRQRTGRTPPIIDSRDVLLDPRAMLTRLCAALGVSFLESMLTWPPGRRSADGVWAPHWYAAVEVSTGFEPYRPKTEPVPRALDGVLRDALACYDQLHTLRLRPDADEPPDQPVSGRPSGTGVP